MFGTVIPNIPGKNKQTTDAYDMVISELMKVITHYNKLLFSVKSKNKVENRLISIMLSKL